jgi:hypothetical protein
MLLFASSMSGFTMATEYKNYDCKYFTVEIPEEWEVREGIWDTPQYYFDDHSIPNLIKNLLSVSIGLDDVRLNFGEPDLLIRKYSGFNETGYIDADDPLIHFLQTFHIKTGELPEPGEQ